MKEKIIEFIKAKKWYLVGGGLVVIAIIGAYISGIIRGMSC